MSRGFMVQGNTIVAKLPFIVGILIILAATYSAPLFLSNYIVGLLISALVYVTLVGAWNILSGYTGYLFLGAAAFYGLGAYMVPLTAEAFSGLGAYIAPLPYLLAIPVGGAVCFAVAFLIGIPFLRLKGPYFIIATYALAEFISHLLLYVEIMSTRTVGRWIEIQDLNLIYVNMVTIAFITVLVAYFIRRSRFGYGLIAIRGDEDAAEASGVPTILHKSLAFGICAFFMGLAGAAAITRLGYIDNTIAFYAFHSFNTIIMGLIGGAGSILGGTISAVFLSLLFEVFITQGEPYPFLVIMGVIIFLIVFYAPGGLIQLMGYARRAVRRNANTSTGGVRNVNSRGKSDYKKFWRP